MDYTKLGQSSIKSRATSYDLGMRAYMLAVYRYMSLALAITGLTAMIISSMPSLQMALLRGPMALLTMFAPVALAIYMSTKFASLSLDQVKKFFAIYAVLLGVSLSSIFLAYTGYSIARTFFITSATFGAMSFYGYTTQKDLTNMASFMIMGVLGIFLASLVNIFIQSEAIHFVTSIIGVIAFTGLIAYDTQKVKDLYYSMNSSALDNESSHKVAIYGAFSLYLDVINLFVVLLRFFGDRRDS